MTDPMRSVSACARTRVLWQLTVGVLWAAGALVGNTGVAIAQQSAPPHSAVAKDGLDRGAALLRQAERALAAGDTRNAAAYAQDALSIYRGLPDNNARAVFGRANAYYYLGAVALVENRDAKALEYWQAALNHYNALSSGADKDRLKLLEEMLPVLLRTERVDDAVAVLREIASEQAKLGESLIKQARSRDNLGILLMRRGQTLEALGELEQAVALSNQGGFAADAKAKYLYDLGLVESRLRRHDAAIGHFRQALSLLAPLAGRQPAQAEILLDLAGSLKATNRADEGRQELVRALELIKNRPDQGVIRARLLVNLANDSYKRAGQREEALRMYREVLALAGDEPGVREAQLAALVNAANHLAETGRMEEAIRTYRETLPRFSGVGTSAEQLGHLRRKLGLLLAKRGIQDEAQENLLAALKVDWQSLAANLPAMTRMQKHLQIESSAKLAEPILSLAFSTPGAESVAAYEAVLLTKALNSEASRAERLELRSTDPAMTAKHERYLELRRQISRRTLEPKEGGSAQPKGALAKDLEQLAKQLQELEGELRKAPGVFAPHARLVATGSGDVLARLQTGERLLEYVVYKRIDFLSGKTTTDRYGVFVLDGTARRVTAADLGDAATINAHIARYRELQQIQATPPKGRLDETELARYAGIVRQLLLDPVLPKRPESGRLYIAPEDLVGLVPFEALPVGQDAAKPRYLVEQREIVYLATGRDLARIGTHSAPKPTAEFWLVGDPAFDATVAMRLAPAAAASTQAAQPAAKPPAGQTKPQFSLVGGRVRTMGADAETPPVDWDRLEGTRTLVLAAAAQARKAGLVPRVLLDAAASEEWVAGMRSPRIAMFATHGSFMRTMPTAFLSMNSEGGQGTRINPDFFETTDPLHRSMLVLAGANRRNHRESWYAVGDRPLTEADARQRGLSRAELDLSRREVGDGLLTAYEVMGMDLNGTELVVLTACESGIGIAPGGKELPGLRQTKGESVAGLRQAFGIAGAHSLVMSMWEVPLNETVEQMQTFLDSWLSRGIARYPAFHEAQLKALASARQRTSTGHPFWWAGFVYAGDPGDR